MSLYIRNNRYYFKKEIQGKKYYRALKLKKGQESLLSARLKQVEEEILAQHFAIPYSPYKQISFIDYCEKYIESKKYKKSWDRDKQRLTIIAECLGDPPLLRIGKSHIEKLEKFLFDRNLKPSTVNRYFELLKHLFNLAIEDGYISENSCRYYQKFVEDGYRRALSREELKRILEAARRIQNQPKSNIQSLIYDLIVFALNTGMRLSEILNVRKSYIKDDIIFYPITEIKYRRRIYSQNSKFKAICLNSIAQATLRKMKSQDDYIFPIKRRHPSVIRKTIARIRKLTGIKDFNFHQLRHTTATLVSSQVGLATAKMILGHSDIKTTLKYTHPEIEEQRKGVAKIEQFYSDILPK